MERTDCVINWPASLMPDLDCVPGDEVFLDNGPHYSLTANSAGTPGLLLMAPDALLQCSDQGRKKKKSRQKKKRSRS